MLIDSFARKEYLILILDSFFFFFRFNVFILFYFILFYCLESIRKTCNHFLFFFSVSFFFLFVVDFVIH